MVIHKVHISKEARFDFEEIVANRPMRISSYKEDLEEHFRYIPPEERYFVKKLYDDDLEKMLLLFFRKGPKLLSMQLWILAGICELSDYNDALEARGLIKNWLDNYIVA